MIKILYPLNLKSKKIAKNRIFSHFSDVTNMSYVGMYLDMNLKSDL